METDHEKTFEKVLVLGSGGREHALVQACLESPLTRSVIAAPGNGGIAADVPCFEVDLEDPQAIATLARKEAVDFVVVGPEVPLCAGAVDVLSEAGIPAYGPNESGARLEGSKAFCKEFLEKYWIPTGASETFTDSASALAYLDQLAAYPIVVKASGLAAGKGVVVAENRKEAADAVVSMLDEKIFGNSGSEVLIEEFLEGEEASIMVMTCGERYIILPPSQDHKRAGEGDSGPNTGGMGAYAPARVVDRQMLSRIEEEIVRPTLKGLVNEGIDYRGTLYVGVMLTPTGPQVLEFNVRFGDPETQVLLPLLATDPLRIMRDIALGTFEPAEVELHNLYAMVVVMAAEGYPGKYRKGDPITLPEKAPAHSRIYHAGTAQDHDQRIVAAGGRVLGVTGLGPYLKAARDHAYAAVEKISFQGCQFRRDIGHRQLGRE